VSSRKKRKAGRDRRKGPRPEVRRTPSQFYDPAPRLFAATVGQAWAFRRRNKSLDPPDASPGSVFEIDQ